MLLRDVDWKVISNEETAELTGKVPNHCVGVGGHGKAITVVHHGRPW